MSCACRIVNVMCLYVRCCWICCVQMSFRIRGELKRESTQNHCEMNQCSQVFVVFIIIYDTHTWYVSVYWLLGITCVSCLDRLLVIWSESALIMRIDDCVRMWGHHSEYQTLNGSMIVCWVAALSWWHIHIHLNMVTLSMLHMCLVTCFITRHIKSIFKLTWSLRYCGYYLNGSVICKYE